MKLTAPQIAAMMDLSSVYGQCDEAEIRQLTAAAIEHKVAAAYGCAYDSFLPQKNLGMGGVPKRSAFVVDKQGLIRYAEVNDSPGQLPNFEALQAVLAKL